MRITIFAVLALTLAACDSPEADADRTAADDATEQPSPDDAPPTPVGLLGVDTLAGAGAYLTDAGGRALYTLEGEDDPGACVDACAQAWPPYTRAAADELTNTVATVGLDPELLGTVDRPDGSAQITYGGHPLYHYARDTAPGQTTGQDVTDEWGEWYLVQPTGDLQEGHASGEEDDS